MNKKKKSKPRTMKSSDGEVAKQKIFNYYIKEMEERTENFTLNNPDAQGTKFYLFQTIRSKDEVRDMIFKLAYFYDRNFVGNKDFMHIPNISNILDNVLKYPILLASKKDKYGDEDILGVTTVKMENNSSIGDNPCFPTVNENVLSITGILAKMNNEDESEIRVRGVGKELFKSAIKAAVEINKIEPVRLIFEVDCRNTNSLNAACKAMKDLQKEGLNINIFITGYYEIKNKDKSLTEAPTFILEIDLTGAKTLSKNEIKFSYANCQKETLFRDLSDVIKNTTNEVRSFINPKDDKTVMYHQIKPVNALAVNLDVGCTAEGNERVPVLKALQLV